MASNSIGAASVSRRVFSCEITEVSCEYGNDKKKKAIFYKKNYTETASCVVENKNGTTTLVGGVTYTIPPKYYFITNHQGKEATLRVLRIANDCTRDEHTKYVIYSNDLQSQTNEIVKVEKEIKDGAIKFLYYNLFTRKLEYGKAAFQDGINEGDFAGAIVNGAAGAKMGSIADYIMAFRFFLLPTLQENDDNYYSTQLIFKTCSHRDNVPKITIVSYPDISFKLVLDFRNVKSEYKGQSVNSLKLDKTKKTDWKVGLSVKYASTEKKLELGHKIETEYNDKGLEKGKKEYEKYGTIYETFKGFADFMEELYQLITNGKLEKDEKKDDKKWITGSISIEPSLLLEWKYSVNDSLSKLGRHFLIDLSVNAIGKLTLDLIKIFEKVVVVGIVGATGGAAAPVKGLLDWLFTKVIPWLIKKFVDVNADLIFKTSVEGGGKIILDTASEKPFDAKLKPVTVIISANLEIGLTVKATFIIKTEFGLNGKAGANVKFDFSSVIEKNDKNNEYGLKLRVKTKLEVEKLTITYSSKDSFEMLDYSVEGSDETEIWSWGGWEKEFEPKEWSLFSNN
jgi:hypothetical protein